MKKTLLTAILLFTVSVSGSIAACVLPAPAGWSMISNPCDGGVTPVSVFLPAVPEGTFLYKWNGFGWDMESYSGGVWSPDMMTLSPGEGTFIFLPSATVLSFAGIPLVPTHQIGLPSGFSMRSAPSGLGLAGFPVAEGDAIYKLLPGGIYDYYAYIDGAWEPAAPVFAVGEAFWVWKTTPGVWVQ